MAATAAQNNQAFLFRAASEQRGRERKEGSNANEQAS